MNKDELIEKGLEIMNQYSGVGDDEKALMGEIISTVLDAVEANLELCCGAKLKHKGYNTSAIMEWLEEDEVLEAINKLR